MCGYFEVLVSVLGMVWVMACIVRGDVCLDVLCNGG